MLTIKHRVTALTLGWSCLPSPSLRLPGLEGAGVADVQLVQRLGWQGGGVRRWVYQDPGRD